MRLEGARFQEIFLIEHLSLHCLGLLFLFLLPLNIFHDLFFIQPNGAYTVSSCPQVTTPIPASKALSDGYDPLEHSVPVSLPVLFACIVDTLAAWHILRSHLSRSYIGISDKTQYDTCTRTGCVIASWTVGSWWVSFWLVARLPGRLIIPTLITLHGRTFSLYPLP